MLLWERPLSPTPRHGPYRPALGMEAALEHVSKHAGRLFNARVVKAYTQILREGFTFTKFASVVKIAAVCLHRRGEAARHRLAET